MTIITMWPDGWLLIILLTVDHVFSGTLTPFNRINFLFSASLTNIPTCFNYYKIQISFPFVISFLKIKRRTDVPNTWLQDFCLLISHAFMLRDSSSLFGTNVRQSVCVWVCLTTSSPNSSVLYKNIHANNSFSCSRCRSSESCYD